MIPVHPAGKALWFIENHFDRDISLDDIADAVGVSRFHMTRVFDTRMGMPVMTYVRARRLAVAAKRLAAGAPDILSVALDAGYNSHEAFTRAFVTVYGVTPEAVRDRNLLDQLKLQEAILMDQVKLDSASPHHLEKDGVKLLAGMNGRYTPKTSADIPSLWQSFVPYLDDMPYYAGPAYTTYGVCYNQSDTGFDYLCAVEVRDGADLPPAFTTVRLEPQTYAVFPHKGHISGLRSTWAAIWDKWLPETGLQVLPAPFFEKYGPEFNGRTGEGGLEVWVPVEA